MSTLTPEQEDLLAAVAAGDLQTDSERVRAECARSRKFAAELESVLGLVARIGEAARDARTDIAAAHAETDAPGEAAIVRSVERLAHAPAVRPRSLSSRRLTILALAAALILAVGYSLFDFSGGNTRQGPQYLGDAVECVAPSGAGADFHEFNFTGILPAGAWFEVVVHDATGAEVLRSARLEGNSFRLTDEQARQLPDEIEWQVTLRDIGGVRASAAASAQR